MGDVKHYLASCNTGVGFVNFFEYINETNDKSFQYILKGGPGTGKNTLMRKIGKYFEKKNFSVEYFYCSSDNSSLDGIRIKEKNVSIVDGTAPHITEALFPGVTHKIINLGEFINPNIKKHKSEILKLNSYKKIYFDLAYKYLESANKILEADMICYEKKQDFQKIKKIEKQLKQKIAYQKNKTGSNRKLFLEAQNFSVEEKNNYNKICEVELNQFEAKTLFNNLITFFNKKNYSIISIHNKINPLYIDALYVDDIHLFIKIKSIKYNNLIKFLIDEAEKNILNAKNCHHQIESYYKENIDKNKLNKLTHNLIQEIKFLN